MDFKLLGSILLIVGTTIGAGMLALPIATANIGFWGSLILLLGSWFVMTAGAFLLLEVNLWLPQNNNLITMARSTIGPVGQIISWVVYLLLLYSLLCAYMAGGSDLFSGLLESAGINLPLWVPLVVFALVFGSVVFMGIRSIDYANRGLMLVKFGSLFILLGLLTPFVSAAKLAGGNLHHITSSSAMMVTITSFGYAAIVPSLRVYFEGDVKKLKKAVLIGSLIPLICYVAWDAVIMGVIPLEGDSGLIAILQSHRSASDFVMVLSQMAKSPFITLFAKLFTSICVLTSFLGVALCLTDFWADGLQLEKKGVNKIVIHSIMLLPPFLVVLFFPNIFIKALEYSGLYCLILLILLPAWMAWNGRYRKHIAHGYRVWGGKPLLLGLIAFALGMGIWSML